jgi:hypothetical protein
MGGGGLTGGVAGERRRRTGGGAAAGARITAKTGMEQVNVLQGQLHWGLGDVLRWLVGSGVVRGAEPDDGCPAAAAGTLTPVSRRLGRTNKRAQELQGVLKEWGAARVVEERRAGVEFIVRHPWRTTAARCSREGGPADFIAVREAVGGGFLAHQGNQVRAWAMAWPEYGAKGRRRRVACTPARGWLGGAGTAALRPMDARHVAPGKGVGLAVPRRMDRRVVGCLGVRTRGGGSR